MTIANLSCSIWSRLHHNGLTSLVGQPFPHFCSPVLCESRRCDHNDTLGNGPALQATATDCMRTHLTLKLDSDTLGTGKYRSNLAACILGSLEGL